MRDLTVVKDGRERGVSDRRQKRRNQWRAPWRGRGSEIERKFVVGSSTFTRRGERQHQ